MSEKTYPYIIVLRLSQAGEGVDAAADRLRVLGVDIDESFSPVPLDPGAGSVMIRGRATKSVAERASARQDVEFFPDLQVGTS